MFIKRLAPNIYDVFIGSGWDNWTRVRRERGSVVVIAGRGLNQFGLNKVKEKICR